MMVGLIIFMTFMVNDLILGRITIPIEFAPVVLITIE